MQVIRKLMNVIKDASSKTENSRSPRTHLRLKSSKLLKILIKNFLHFLYYYKHSAKWSMKSNMVDRESSTEIFLFGWNNRNPDTCLAMMNKLPIEYNMANFLAFRIRNGTYNEAYNKTHSQT